MNFCPFFCYWKSKRTAGKVKKKNDFLPFFAKNRNFSRKNISTKSQICDFCLGDFRLSLSIFCIFLHFSKKSQKNDNGIFFSNFFLRMHFENFWSNVWRIFQKNRKMRKNMIFFCQKTMGRRTGFPKFPKKFSMTSFFFF